jgi:hypothetical protein
MTGRYVLNVGVLQPANPGKRFARTHWKEDEMRSDQVGQSVRLSAKAKAKMKRKETPFESVNDPGPRSMKLTGFDREGVVFGGPYEDRRRAGFGDTYGINLAAEVTDVAHVELAIKDFSTPARFALRAYRKAVEDAVVRVLRGERVYVGCLMGQGRTGTFLACMAKMCGSRDPIAQTRELYNPRAIETISQEKFIEGLGCRLSQLKIALRLRLGRGK